MNVTAQFAKPEQVEITLTVTMTSAEWRKVKVALDAGFTGTSAEYRLRNAIYEVISSTQKIAQQDVAEGDNAS